MPKKYLILIGFIAISVCIGGWGKRRTQQENDAIAKGDHVKVLKLVLDAFGRTEADLTKNGGWKEIWEQDKKRFTSLRAELNGLAAKGAEAIERTDNLVVLEMIKNKRLFFLRSQSSILSSAVFNKYQSKDTANKPVWVKTVSTALPDWEICKFDEASNLKVDTYNGHRLILRKSQTFGGGPEMQRLPRPWDNKKPEVRVRHSYIDLVVFPENLAINGEHAEKIPWLDISNENYLRPVYIGQGHGFKWFVNTTIYKQEDLRDILKLNGGDDRIQLIIDVFATGASENSLGRLISKYGDQALPYIEKAVQKERNKKNGRVVIALTYIKTKKATQLLKKYYATPEMKKPAIRALCNYLRKECKEEYLGILESRTYVSRAGQACVQYDWKEAIPILEKICGQPNTWDNFYYAFTAKRKLQRLPIPDKVLEAQKTINKLARNSNDINIANAEKAKQIILKSQDLEAVSFIAFELITYRHGGKGSIPNRQNHDRINDIGLDILNNLPTQYRINRLKVLSRISESYLSPETKKKLAKLIK